MKNSNVAPKHISWIKRAKNRIKYMRQSENPILQFFAERLFNCATVMHTIKSILTDKQSRAVLYMKIFQHEQVHQTTPATTMNRFPVIFSACRTYFQEKNKSELRILSFGCSTGEEVLTLRHYFPDTTIVGAEINQHSLEICRKRQHDSKMIFIESTREEIARNGPYDAVFCMAVFQRTPQLIQEKRIADLSKIYPFNRFEQQVCNLDKCVKEGGLMVVHYSQYDFMDTQIAPKYSVYGDYNQDHYGSYIFNKESKRIIEKRRRYSIFIKTREKNT